MSNIIEKSSGPRTEPCGMPEMINFTLLVLVFFSGLILSSSVFLLFLEPFLETYLLVPGSWFLHYFI